MEPHVWVRSGRKQVAVLGCGVDNAYPREQHTLMEAMLARGGISSGATMGVPPRLQRFPLRNRLISGLAQEVVVVEGGVGSGSLITALQAPARVRPVYAVPGSLFAPGSRDPHTLVESGARALGDAPLHVNRVAERCGLGVGRLAGALATLEARGLVRQAPGKQFTRRSGFQGPGARHHPGGDPWPNHSSS